MIDTALLEEQITRMDQIYDQRATKIKLLIQQQKEEGKLIASMKKGLDKLKQLADANPEQTERPYP